MTKPLTFTGNSITVSIKISPKGQITIPPDIQEKLGLLPSTEIQLEVTGNILQIRKPRTLSWGKQLAV